MQQDLDKLIGPSDKGEYAVGDTLTFAEDGKQHSGTVIHCAKPQTTATGKQLPRLYTVDCGDGWPHLVESRQIVGKERIVA